MPRASQMQPAVIAGVSRENLCRRYIELLATKRSRPSRHRSTGQRRSPHPPACQPKFGYQRTLPVGLGEAARRLKSSSYSPDEIITGPIVEVRHVPDDPFGEISVQTMRRGRMTEVREATQLRSTRADFRVGPAAAGRLPSAVGYVEAAGNASASQKPRQVYPVDETYLPHTDRGGDLTPTASSRSASSSTFRGSTSPHWECRASSITRQRKLLGSTEVLCDLKARPGIPQTPVEAAGMTLPGRLAASPRAAIRAGSESHADRTRTALATAGRCDGGCRWRIGWRCHSSRKARRDSVVCSWLASTCALR